MTLNVATSITPAVWHAYPARGVRVVHAAHARRQAHVAQRLERLAAREQKVRAFEPRQCLEQL